MHISCLLKYFVKVCESDCVSQMYSSLIERVLYCILMKHWCLFFVVIELVRYAKRGMICI